MELKHKHLLVRAEVLDPPKDLKMMRKWTKNLIKDISIGINDHLEPLSES